MLKEIMSEKPEYGAMSEKQRLKRQYLMNSRHQKLAGDLAAHFGVFVSAIGAATVSISRNFFS